MKKWKIALISVVILIVAGAGTLYYYLEVKKYDTKDRKVAEIVKSDYEVLLPGDTAIEETGTITKSSVQTDTEESQESNANSAAEEPDGNPLTASAATKAKNATAKVKKSTTTSSVQASSTSAIPAKVTAESIINKYKPSFENLQQQADAKVNSLISYAISEYKTKKADGQEVSYFYFYSKYSSVGKVLESNTDASFNVIYSALENELKSNGFSGSEATGLRTQYKTLKKNQRNTLINEAMSRLN